MKKLTGFIMSVFLLLGLTACSQSPEERIVGKWELNDGSDEMNYWEIKEDEITITSESGEILSTQGYIITELEDTEDEKFKIEFNELSNESMEIFEGLFDVSIEGYFENENTIIGTSFMDSSSIGDFELNRVKEGETEEVASKNKNSSDEKNKLYSMSNIKYSIPENWTEEISDENLKYYYPEEAMLMVAYMDLDGTLSNDEIRADFIEGYASGFESYDLISESEITVAGKTKGRKNAKQLPSIAGTTPSNARASVPSNQQKNDRTQRPTTRSYQTGQQIGKVLDSKNRASNFVAQKKQQVKELPKTVTGNLHQTISDFKQGMSDERTESVTSKNRPVVQSRKTKQEKKRGTTNPTTDKNHQRPAVDSVQAVNKIQQASTSNKRIDSVSRKNRPVIQSRKTNREMKPIRSTVTRPPVQHRPSNKIQTVSQEVPQGQTASKVQERITKQRNRSIKQQPSIKQQAPISRKQPTRYMTNQKQTTSTVRYSQNNRQKKNVRFTRPMKRK